MDAVVENGRRNCFMDQKDFKMKCNQFCTFRKSPTNPMIK
jgi:hypothetical protein